MPDKFSYLLNDDNTVGEIDDTIIKQHAWAGVMEFALKHVFARDILPWVEDIAQLMYQVGRSGGKDFIALVLQYVLERSQISNQEAFFKLINTKISSEVGDNLMTLAEQLRQEGRLEGRLEGKQEGRLEGEREVAKRMLEVGSKPEFIIQVTGLSLEQIRELRNIRLEPTN